MSELKVLVLVHPSCIPPLGATPQKADWSNWKTEFYLKKSLRRLGHKALFCGVSDDLNQVKSAIDQYSPHIVFNLLEEFQGKAGFDAHVVSYLELLGIPYTGCNPSGLLIGRDKALAKKILSYHNILTPRFFTVDQQKNFSLPSDLKYPLIVKSLVEEASLGISQDSIVDQEDKLRDRIEFIHNKIETPALVEEYIEGRELYVGVIGNKQLKVLPAWELKFGDLKEKGHPIATRNVKFNKAYCEKYSIKKGLAKNLNPFTERKIEHVAREAYKALKLSGYARLDLRLTENDEVYFLEANPNAELAQGECLADAAHNSEMKYDQLIAKIMSLGLSYETAA